MNDIEPINQTKLFGLSHFIKELIHLYDSHKLPNRILLSGQKGLGKSTLAYHFINYVLSKDEKLKYDLDKFEINTENQSYKTVLNKSNPNLISVNIKEDNKSIEIDQIRNLISQLNKSSFNNKPRFVLIDNIEFLNVNSINALLKILEEPSSNIFFILINNNKNILATLLSRCINFKISLSNKECLEISEKLIDKHLNIILNNELINYYSTPGNIYNLIKFSEDNKYDLKRLNLKELLKIIIKNNYYKKNVLPKSLIYEFIEHYFSKINSSTTIQVHNIYQYFINRISETRKFNLDEESLFMEIEEKILNG